MLEVQSDQWIRQRASHSVTSNILLAVIVAKQVLDDHCHQLTRCWRAKSLFLDTRLGEVCRSNAVELLLMITEGCLQRKAEEF